MARNGAPFLLIPLLLAGCSLTRPFFESNHRTPDPADFPELPAGPSLDVLVFGDWGTGGPGQRRVARAMEDSFSSNPPDLVLSMGDNFYPNGVKNTEDPLWNRVFQKVYSGPFWDSLTFYPVLGNHDWVGNPLAQIQYSEIDPRWQMRGFHYAFRESLPGGGTALFLAMDTDPMQGERNASVAQLAWVDSLLVASRDRWVVAFGHHPLATGGRHEQDEYFRKRVIPLLAGRASIYLSGHNHSQEFLPASPMLPQAVCGGGAGRDNRYPVRDTEGTMVAFTNGGWCYLRLFSEVMAVELYDGEGALRFRYLISGDPL